VMWVCMGVAATDLATPLGPPCFPLHFAIHPSACILQPVEPLAILLRTNDASDGVVCLGLTAILAKKAGPKPGHRLTLPSVLRAELLMGQYGMCPDRTSISLPCLDPCGP
jgi:hypothetical protein